MNIFNFYRNYNNSRLYYSSELVQSFMLRIYKWMFYGLSITSFISWYISKSRYLLQFFCFNQKITFFLFIFQIFIVFILSSCINKLSEKTIIGLFILYSILTGINLSIIFLIYTSLEIFTSLFITSLTFLLMTLYGYITKNDLTSFGSLLIMLLLGIFISSILNIYFENEFIMWIISYVSILLFTGLIAYDTQKLKILGNELIYINNNDLLNKYSVLGALILYLDFINLFLIPLKIINKKNKFK